MSAFSTERTPAQVDDIKFDRCAVATSASAVIWLTTVQDLVVTGVN